MSLWVRVLLWIAAVFFVLSAAVKMVLWTGSHLDEHIPDEEELWPPDTATRDGDHITILPPDKM